MSPSTDRRDGGFSLIEVIVSFGILALLITALTPALVVGIRSNDVARRALQEKGFAQTEVELMRNLPFHVAPAAGDFIDVLDRFFRDLTPPATPPVCGDGEQFGAPTRDAIGYVAAASPRCPWEPDGAFYRQVRTIADDPQLAGFVLVINTQFLTDTTPPTVVTPASGYDNSQVGRDDPPTSQIGVTVSVFRDDREARRPMTTYTQIGRRDQLDPQVRSSVDISAVDLGTVLPDGLPLTLSGGLINLAASLTHVSRVNAVVASTTTGVSTGEQAGGAGLALSGPPNASVAAESQAAGSLDATTCSLVCWGPTERSALTLTAGSGLPNAASPGTPVRSILRSGDLSLSTGQGTVLRPDLLLTGRLVDFDDNAAVPQVRDGTTGNCRASETGATARIASSGWLRTTAPEDTAEPSVVDACGITGASTLSILPTTFAPSGIVRVTLESASARCTVRGANHSTTAEVTYDAVVEQWVAGGAYVEVARIDETTETDSLADVPLTNPLGNSRGTVGDYIESWSSLTRSEILTSTGDGEVDVTVPGIINIVTQPVRSGTENGVDPVSSVSISVGTLSCHAEDRR